MDKSAEEIRPIPGDLKTPETYETPTKSPRKEQVLVRFQYGKEKDIIGDRKGEK